MLTDYAFSHLKASPIQLSNEPACHCYAFPQGAQAQLQFFRCSTRTARSFDRIVSSSWTVIDGMTAVDEMGID